MMKIAFLLSSYAGEKLGGAELQAYYLARECLAKGYQASYVYLAHDGKARDDSGIGLVPISRCGVAKRFGLGYFIYRKRVLSALDRVQPDIIYQRGGSALTGVAAEYCKTRGNCRLIWHIASPGDVEPFQLGWSRSVLSGYIDKGYCEYGIKNADVIIGQARYQDRLLKEHYGRECDLIVPNFHPVPRSEIRKEVGVRVVWIGNFKRCKRPELFIEVAAELKDCRDARFVMIGRQGERKWHSRLQREMASVDNLEYLGEKPVDEVNRILCESHILVNTSTREGFPNTFVQAWMRKVPVVSLDVDPDDILVRERIGFHSKSVRNMINDLESLIKDRVLVDETGQRAQRYALANHAIEENANKILRLFNNPHQ